MISGFHLNVHENCALLGYYAASSGDSLQTFRGNLFVPSEFTHVGCGKLSASSEAKRQVNHSSVAGRSRGVPLFQKRGTHLDARSVSTGAKEVGT